MMNTLCRPLTIAFFAVSFFISGLSANLVSAQSSASEPMVTLTPEEQAWLAAHPEIVLGTTTEYSPMVFKRADGTHGGMLVDIYKEVNRRLPTRIRLHIEDPWTKVQEKAQNREIDGLAMGARDPNRDALYNATDVIVPTYFSVFARSRDEYRLKHFSELKGMRIGYKRAARPTRTLLEKLPSAILEPYDSHEAMTQALLRKEIDVIVAWISYDHWRKEKLQGTIDNILFIEEYPIEMVSHIRKDWPDLIPILNKTIAVLQQDELPRIINKWFGKYPRLSTATRVPLTSEERAWLDTRPTIKARVGNAPPFHFIDQGKPAGFSVELMDRIADQIGLDVQYISGIPWPEGLEHIKHQDGKVDLLLTAMNTPDRREFMLFSRNYLEQPFIIYTREDNQTIRNINDLVGKTVAIEKGYALVEMIRSAYPGIHLMEVKGVAPEALRAVSSGEADAYIGNMAITNYHLGNLGMTHLKSVATAPFAFHTNGFGVRKDWPELVSILNKALNVISPEERFSILEKWGGVDAELMASATFRNQLNEEEKAWLDQMHTVRVRIVDYPPYQIIKKNEAPEGIAIDYLKLIEDRTGINFKFEVTDMPFADFLENMKQGKGPDMTAIIVPTPEREQYLSFSETYLSSPYVIFIREEDSPILDIQGLVGKSVAVPRGFAVQEQLSRDYPQIRLALFDSDEKSLQAVATGQADAYIGNLTVASHIVHQRGLSHLKVTATAPFGGQVLSMGCSKDLSELTSIINKALASITEEEKTAIRNKYLAIKFEQGINKTEVLKWVLTVGGLALGFLLVILFWNRQLSREIGRRKKTELALKEAEERLLTTFENMPIAAVMIDKDEGFHLINRQFLELFEYTMEELPTVSEWWPRAYPDPEYREWVISTWNELVQISRETGDNIISKEYKVTCKNGMVRDIEFSGHALGEGYLVTGIDNTERNQVSESLVKAKEAAEIANQAKSIFLANMSHELRTPLNAILGFSRMLTQKSNASADEKEKLTIINRSGQHLLSMINDVLDLSKIEAGRIELQENPFDLVDLIEEISVMIQSRATEKGISVAMETDSINFPYVKADVGKLRQILSNLLSNAVKFTDEGGVTIRCATEPMPEESGHCRIMIEVEDTGPGIEPAGQAKIFEPFVQEREVPERKGTGLGLSICKRYADLMGGTIEVESEIGKGSLFRVRLPAEIAEAADLKTPVDDKPRVIGLASTQKTWRILVADDNRENLLLLKSLLEEVGFFVLEAENGQEAVAAFKKERPDFVWMDMRMPVMDGYEAVRQIRQCTGGDTVPILAITASAFKEQRDDVLAAGCNDMVIKPFRAHEIFEAMGRFLDIEYIYETESEAAPDRVREVELTPSMLADFPEELLHELREATLALNREDALEVIARIADHTPEVATGLKELVDNYQMVELRDLIVMSGTEHA